MIEAIDGPAKGKTFAIRRAPLMLRLVHDEERDAWDALDQIEDKPNTHEKVYVYKREPNTWSFVCVRPGGRYETGLYRHVPFDGDEAVLYETSAWQEWVIAYVEMLPS